MTNDPDGNLQGSDLERFRARQRSRNRVLGLVLGALAVLFFAITIVKLGLQSSGKM